MKVLFTEKARKEFLGMERTMQERFKSAILKIKEYPHRKHLKYGLPYYVIKVTKQARIIYEIEEEVIYILHCFKTHKSYEKWYKE